MKKWVPSPPNQSCSFLSFLHLTKSPHRLVVYLTFLIFNTNYNLPDLLLLCESHWIASILISFIVCINKDELILCHGILFIKWFKSHFICHNAKNKSVGATGPSRFTFIL